MLTRSWDKPSASEMDRDNLPLISVLCVTRNRADLLPRCLDSLLEQDYPCIEVIVIDNASNDNTGKLIKENYPLCRYIRTHKNIGFFPALNLAIANANGAFIFTIDDDASFQCPSSLSCMAAACSDDNVHVVTCNIEGPHEKALEATDRYTRSFKTGFSLIRTSSVLGIIGFYPDEFFRSGGEEYLATKVWDSGGRVLTLSEVRMYHHQAMQGRSQRDWIFHGTRSQILVAFMRNHAIILVPRLLSKFIHGGRKAAANGLRPLFHWLGAWASATVACGKALRSRDPVSLRTELLLWKLARERIGTTQQLDAAVSWAEQVASSISLRKSGRLPITRGAVGRR